jgi:hypothetical protein
MILTMKKCFILNVVFLLTLAQVIANNPILKTTGNPVTPDKVLPYSDLMIDITLPYAEDTLSIAEGNTKREQRYHFPELDAQLTAAVDAFVGSIDPDDMDDLTNILPNAEEIEGRKVIAAAQLGGTKIEDFDDLLNMTLPAYRIQKIGNIEAIIVINSLRLDSSPNDGLYPGGRLGIYVGIKIPQKSYDSEGRKRNVTLIFGTESISFTKEGGIKTGNIALVNDTYFELGGSKKRSIVKLLKGDLNNDTGTYISFGCNGVEEFGIGGDIYFTREWMMPVNGNGEISQDPLDRTKGNFQLIVQDWNNMLITTDIEKPFVLSKFKEVTFALGNCSIDLSDFVNPPGIKFPEGYVHQENGPVNLWRGVYIETFELTFPEPFKKKCDGNYGNSNDPANPGCRMTVSAENLLIDPSGVSGKFSISGQAPLASGALMNKKWNWSLDEVSLEVTQSKFDKFEFSGGIVLPITKKETPFAYEGYIGFINGGTLEEQEFSYYFGVTLQDNIEFPLFKGFNVSLDSNTQLNVLVENGEFKPSAVLFGSMSIGKGGGGASTDEMNVPSILFTDIRLKTEGQVISHGNVFLQGGDNKLNNFPIQISGIGLGFGQNTAHLDFDLGIQLMKQSDGGLNASGSFSIYGKLITNVIGAHQWKYDKVVMTDFEVLIDLPLFKGCGQLTIFKEDPIYGNGFSAFLEAHIMAKPEDGTAPGGNSGYGCQDEISSAFSLTMAAVFGNANGLRYFMVDGYASGDAVKVPLAPTPLALTGFGGGVQYRMKLNGYNDPLVNSPGTAFPIGVDASGLIYKPDAGTLFGIKFAVGIATVGGDAAGGSPINGRLNCSIRFGSGLSLQNITFWGTAELINPVVNGGLPLPDVFDKIESLNLSEPEMHEQDLNEVKNAEDKIMAKLGISLDFDGGFSFHGFAEVKIKAAGGKLNGLGQLDLLIDPNSTPQYDGGRWHLYVGGYDNEAVQVPDFSNPENEITLYPVSVSIDYGGLNVVAGAYFLMGNDIPGPPGINAAAANFFDLPLNSNVENREILGCGSRDAAKGTGVAFGASLTVKFEKKIRKKIIFKKVTILNIKVNGGAGFDIALLQYGPETSCSGSPGEAHGLNGFRATGTVWAYVDVNGKVLGVRLPGIGVGVLLKADIPNPSYFQAIVVLKFIKKWKFDFDIGEECGHPCSIVVP